MNRFAIGFTAILFAMGANQVLAASTLTRYAKITGTASAPSPGKCTRAYSNQCVSGSCTCVTVPNATVGLVPGQVGIAGTGTANVFLSFDDGAATESSPGVGCTPFFGIARLSTKRAGKQSTEVINLNGVKCSPTTTADFPILGGFGISASPAPVNGGTGFGRFTGFLDPDGSFTMKLHGPITQ